MASSNAPVPTPVQSIPQDPIPENPAGDNMAAYLMQEKGHWEVHPSEMYEPGEGEVLIKIRAIAVQQMEGFQKHLAIKKNVTYPLVLGGLIAGDVISCGPNCTRLVPGDRVTGGLNVWVSGGKRKYAGHQRYTLGLEFEMVKIPQGSSLSHAEALASGYQSGAHAIYKVLNMSLPTVEPPEQPKPKGQKIVIWGASGFMGAMGISYSKLSGYEVIAVCSPRNFDLVKSRGADHVFDRNDPETPAKIRELFPIDYYYDAVKEPAALKGLISIISPDGETGPDDKNNKPVKIAMVIPPSMPGMPKPPEGVQLELLAFKNYLPEHKEYVDWLLGKDGFLERGLKGGWLRGTNVEIIGGLDRLEGAVDRVWEGAVSGRKLVIDPWM